jgi:hypothetical protein
MPRTLRSVTCGLLLTATCAVGACDRGLPARPPKPAAASPPSPTPAPDGRVISPSQTVHEARRLRNRSAFDDLEEYLLPDQRTAVIANLLAVDRLVVAYRSLNRLIEDRIGPGSATWINADAIANIAGVFSADVEIIDETIDDDYALVAFSVAGRVPLEEITLVRRDNRWRLRGEAPAPELSLQLRKLAAAADRVRLLLNTRDMTADELRSELALRQDPILKRIQELSEQAPR